MSNRKKRACWTLFIPSIHHDCSWKLFNWWYTIQQNIQIHTSLCSYHQKTPWYWRWCPIFTICRALTAGAGENPTASVTETQQLEIWMVWICQAMSSHVKPQVSSWAHPYLKKCDLNRPGWVNQIPLFKRGVPNIGLIFSCVLVVFPNKCYLV